jgi:ABC-type transporter Mla MlaB component
MKNRKSTTPKNAARARRNAVFALPADCSIANADSLRAALVDLVAQGRQVTLDAAAVQRIDTACLQLLVAFSCERRAAARPVAWAGVPGSLAERAALLSLSDALGLSSQDGAQPVAQ